MKTRRQRILDTVAKLAADFMYYDRKEDEGLPRGAIEEAIQKGEVSELEILFHFAKGAGMLNTRYRIGDRVRKTKGSSWHGTVCGFYFTELTPVGICVESEREKGSVQIYPEKALEKVPKE